MPATSGQYKNKNFYDIFCMQLLGQIYDVRVRTFVPPPSHDLFLFMCQIRHFDEKPSPPAKMFTHLLVVHSMSNKKPAYFILVPWCA